MVINKLYIGVEGQSKLIYDGSYGIALDDVSSRSISVSDKNITIKWADPVDFEKSGESIAKWAGTKVVRKAGSAPSSVTDGTVVIDSKTRNAYSSTGFVDQNLTYGTKYYYRYFPYTTEQVYTTGSYSSATVSAIYGAEWAGTSSPAWTRTDLAANFSDPSPAVNNGTGSSPFDNIAPWSGLKRITDSTGGELVEIPKYYYKWTYDGTKMKLQISPTTFSGAKVSPAHANRGDGTGERNVVYVGRYHCASTYKSTTGVKPAVSKTRATFRSGIHNLGSTYWQYDYAMYWTIMMLYLVEYANWNTQAKIGYGGGNGSSLENNGLTDAMQYHTGTNAKNRTTYGHVQYRYIEGLWDNVMDWCDGIYFNNTNIYCIKNPSSFSDTTGGTKVGTRNITSGWTKAFTHPTASGFEYALFPSEVGGSNSTYVCDSNWSQTSTGVTLCVGGNFGTGLEQGAFMVSSTGAASVTVSDVGSRLMKLP